MSEVAPKNAPAENDHSTEEHTAPYVHKQPSNLRAESGIFKGVNPRITIMAGLIVVAFLYFGIAFPELSENVFDQGRESITEYLKWFYIDLVTFLLGFSIWLLAGRYGNVRLGHDDDRPEFSYFSWFSMLFSAGMGIGLVFWSIAEPILHFESNPFSEGADPQLAAQTAMRMTFFHWGLHPWAIYAVVGLALCYYAYRKKLPLTIRSALYPLIGDRIYGPWGAAADLMAIFGTVFGVATTLGLGVTQMNMGLSQILGIEISDVNKLIIIAVVSGAATLSVVSGVGKGVRIFSEINLWLSIFLLLFILIAGPTVYLLNSYSQNLGDYLNHLLTLSLFTDAHGDGEWQASWTAFYWGWWIAWTPFVGMFIARISRGRTIREFILGVLMVPTLLAFFWLTLFGNTGLYIEMFEGGGITEAVNEDVTLALYKTLELMDAGIFASLAAIVATILIATYFITSSDSGTLVITILLATGATSPPRGQRVFWGITEGALAAVLLYAGGLEALQAASIIVALPFSFVVIFLCYGLVVALREETAPLSKALSQESAYHRQENLGTVIQESLPEGLEQAVQEAIEKADPEKALKTAVREALPDTVQSLTQESTSALNRAVREILVESPKETKHPHAIYGAVRKVFRQNPDVPPEEWEPENLKSALSDALTEEGAAVLKQTIRMALKEEKDEVLNSAMEDVLEEYAYKDLPRIIREVQQATPTEWDVDSLEKAVRKVVDAHPDTPLDSWQTENLKKSIISALSDKSSTVLQTAVQEALEDESTTGAVQNAVKEYLGDESKNVLQSAVEMALKEESEGGEENRINSSMDSMLEEYAYKNLPDIIREVQQDTEKEWDAESLHKAVRKVVDAHPDTPPDKWKADSLKQSIISALSDKSSNVLQSAVQEALEDESASGAVQSAVKEFLDDKTTNVIQTAVEDVLRESGSEVVKDAVKESLKDQGSPHLKMAIEEILQENPEEAQRPESLRQAISETLGKHPNASLESWDKENLKTSIRDALKKQGENIQKKVEAVFSGEKTENEEDPEKK